MLVNYVGTKDFFSLKSDGPVLLYQFVTYNEII